MSAEGSMWAAAVEQAFRAACEPNPGDRRNDMGGCTPSEAANEWRWLTAPHGPWAESRIRICNLNGVDPEIVRQEALRRGASRQAALGLRHEMRREDEKAKPSPYKDPRFGKQPSPEMLERNSKVAADYAAGIPKAVIAARYGLAWGTVKKIAQLVGVHRPIAQKLKEIEAAWRAETDMAARKYGDRAARNAALLEEYAAGVAMVDLSRKYSLAAGTIHAMAVQNEVRRPEGMRAEINNRARAAKAAKIDARNAEILERAARGESRSEIAAHFGMTHAALDSAITRARKKAGSAVESGGSRAAGGEGGAVSVSFHVQNMQESPR
jgi:DNA-binding NarL/FixJ family response regulator